MKLSDLIRDETDALSSARTGFWVWTLFTIALVFGVAAGFLEDPGNAVWSLVGGVFMALITWAAGPRLAQYIGPRIGEVAKAIGDARRDPRLPNNRHDDERGSPQ